MPAEFREMRVTVRIDIEVLIDQRRSGKLVEDQKKNRSTCRSRKFSKLDSDFGTREDAGAREPHKKHHGNHKRG
jgi:hypothetical protein